MQPLVPTEHGTVCGYRLSCYLSACRISRRLVVGTKWSRDKGPGPSRGGRLSLSAWPASGHLSWPPGYWVKGLGSKKMACFLGDPPQPRSCTPSRGSGAGADLRTGLAQAGCGTGGVGFSGRQVRQTEPQSRRVEGGPDLGVTVPAPWVGKVFETALAQ